MIHKKMEILYNYELGQDIIIDENLIGEDVSVENYSELGNRPISYSLSAKFKKWPNNTIKYRYANNVDFQLKQDIESAAFDWIEATNGTHVINSYN